MSIVLSITLLLAAFSEGFNLRAERILDVFAADTYVVPEGSSGALTAQSPFPARAVDAVDGAIEARGMAAMRTGIAVDGETTSLVVVSVNDGDPWPAVTDGRGIEGPGEIVADAEVGLVAIGDRVTIGTEEFLVVGMTETATFDLANAAVFMGKDDLDNIFFAGENMLTTVAVVGTPSSVPDGLVVQDRGQVFDDLLVKAEDAKKSIDAFTVTLWVLAVVIVGAILYLAALERIRDFAIFKATGAANVDLVLGLTLQAVILGAISGVTAIGLAHLLLPIYPGLLSLPAANVWIAVPVAIVIAALSSVVGVRRAISVDPSQAFG